MPSVFRPMISMPGCSKELALALYKRGILSSGKACALAGLSRWEWVEILGQRKVSRHYTQSDLEKDIAHVKRGK
jgi:predicted HTH domain antitoxin